jgi:Raf kinase inhibitor-like YbhB/YbcL family protein
MKSGASFFAFALTLLLALAPGGASAFEVNSPEIEVDKPIGEKFVYNSFGCSGENISPVLMWSEPPAGTKSFAVLVHDPDAPTGGAGFWHWLVIDIPAFIRSLQADAGAANGKKLPAGARQLDNDFGDAAWGGPCPPKGAGAHHYHFTIYALSVAKLDLPPHAKAAIVGLTIHQNALAKATIVRHYGR